jgi:hypothetical protein
VISAYWRLYHRQYVVAEAGVVFFSKNWNSMVRTVIRSTAACEKKALYLEYLDVYELYFE